MSEQENVQAVQRLYASFERGDVHSALEMLTEDVDWRSPVTRTEPSEPSWPRPRRGHEQVAQFFKELGEKVQPEPFKLLKFTAQSDKVVVEGRIGGASSFSI